MYQNSGPTGQKIVNFLTGMWLGHPLHPVLTDIPVGAWTTAIVLDRMSEDTHSRGLERGADVTVALGVAGAVGAAVSGLTDWHYTVGEPRRTGLLHATFNTVALGLYAGSMISRASRNRALGRDLAMAGYLVMTLGAYLGGDLVYRQKIGVNHAPEEIDAPEFTAVMNELDLPENQLTRASLKQIPIVLLRRGSQIYALAEVCAHMGGPLADGSIEEDEQGNPAVVCPWHGSIFDMKSGNVINGPSAYPQPCFDTRVRDGKIEVRYWAEAKPAE